MKIGSIYTAAIIIVLAFSGPSLAGKGGGGMGGSGHQQGMDMAPRQSGDTEQRSDKALQQDRDKEQYRGPDADRDTQKAKSKGLGEGTGKGDQLRTRDQDQLREQSPATD